MSFHCTSDYLVRDHINTPGARDTPADLHGTCAYGCVNGTSSVVEEVKAPIDKPDDPSSIFATPEGEN